MNQGEPEPAPPAETAVLQQLTGRVGELERQVAELRHALGKASPAQATLPRAGFPEAPIPPPLSSPPAAQPVRPESQQTRSLEDRLGSQLFNFIGILALLFGASWALKLAIDHGLLGPTARVTLGLVAGAGLVVWSEHFRRRSMPAFSATLKAVGSSVLYLSLWAGFQLFHLFPAAIALVAMVLVTAWNGYMAWSQEAELLAFYALLGGMLTPILLHTGADHELFLFSYLAIVDLGSVLLLRSRNWPRLLVPAFLGTAAYFAGYYLQFFHVASGSAGHWDTQSAEMALFALVFFALFALVTTRAWESEGLAPLDQRNFVLLPLANGAFVGGALAAVFQDSGLHAVLPWVMVALGALFLALVRKQRTPVSAATHLAVAVVFLTVAIPLKASGHTLTIAWLAEGLALFWITCTMRLETPAKCHALTLLTGVSYGLGLASLVARWTWPWSFSWNGMNHPPEPFYTANLGSALAAVAALAGAVFLALPRFGSRSRPAHLRAFFWGLAAIDGVALLLALGELTAASGPARTAFAHADFARALIGLALLAGTAILARRMAFPQTGPAPHPRQTKLFSRLMQTDVVVFNLVALFTLVRETSALWTDAGDSLQRSLAVSAVLMGYAALLLAVGFWRQQAFVRWQALVLILVTIVKVFLYDISGLSAGYRVASFLALGALLLAVSFAYQKDWLSLRASRAHASGDHA